MKFGAIQKLYICFYENENQLPAAQQLVVLEAPPRFANMDVGETICNVLIFSPAFRSRSYSITTLLSLDCIRIDDGEWLYYLLLKFCNSATIENASNLYIRIYYV